MLATQEKCSRPSVAGTHNRGVFAHRSKLTADDFFSHRNSNLLKTSSSRERKKLAQHLWKLQIPMWYTASLRLSGRRISERYAFYSVTPRLWTSTHVPDTGAGQVSYHCDVEKLFGATAEESYLESAIRIYDREILPGQKVFPPGCEDDSSAYEVAKRYNVHNWISRLQKVQVSLL